MRHFSPDERAQDAVACRLSVAISVGGLMDLESERAAPDADKPRLGACRPAEILSGPSRQ